MLEKIYIDGFRHFKNFTLDLNEPHLLLCGLNGTGKSSILDVLSRIQLFLINYLPVTSVCKTEDIPVWDKAEVGSSQTSFGITLKHNKSLYAYTLEIRHNFLESRCRVQEEVLNLNGENIYFSSAGRAEVKGDRGKELDFPVDWSVSALELGSRQNKKIKDFLTVIKSKLINISLNPYALSAIHQQEEPLLNLDGSNFSAWYAHVVDFDITAVASTLSEYESFIPGFKKASLKKEGKSKELNIIISGGDRESFPISFDNLSSGQKILFAIYLIIKSAQKNSIICIDEFENYLSPIELQPIYDSIQDAYEERNIRFLIISHNHKTIEWFSDSVVILFTSGFPPFVRIEKFIKENNITVIDNLMSKLAV